MGGAPRAATSAASRFGRGGIPPLGRLTGPACLLAGMLAVLPSSHARAQPAAWNRQAPEFAEALRLARSGKVDAAVERLDGLRSAGPGIDVPPPPALDLAAGGILETAGRFDEALARYRAAAGSPLADAALLRAGRLRLSRRDAAGARADLGNVSPASGAFVEARLAMADSLLREGRFEAARVVVDDLLQDTLGSSNLFAARMARVRVLAATERIDRARAEAFLAWVHAPGQRDADRAAAVLAALEAPPDGAQRMLRDLVQARGRTLQQMAKQVRRSAKRMNRLDPGLPALIEGVAARSARRTRERAVALLEQAVARAGEPRVRDYAVLSLARALVAVGRDDEALVRFQALVEAGPPGPFAAAAGFEGSRCATRLGDATRAGTLLDHVARSHPEGGTLARIRWERALAALVAGDDATALHRLDAALVRVDRGNGVPFDDVERLRYFRGVVLARLGREAEARQDLLRVARSAPWSYYGVLAASRVGADDAGTARPPADAGRTSGPLPDGSPAWDVPAGEAAPIGDLDGPVWLWRLGLESEARADLRARARMGLLDESGTRLLARMVGQGRGHRGVLGMQEHLRGPFDPGDAALFVSAHPRPYADAVEAAARTTGLDPALIFAVMRVESRFSHRARSPAGAIGLMQVLRGTARRVASVTLEDRRLASRLTRPTENILIGAALLKELHGHLGGHLPLMLVGYHAGSGTARRFHRTLGHLPTDVFVEVLPYTQTGRYIRRVIGLAAGYRALYDNAGREPLRLEDRLPESLGPFLERPLPPPGA